MPKETVWRYSARTPSPSTSDEQPDERVNLRWRDAQLMRELDLSSRYDPAKFTETPFTMAKAAARQRSASSEKAEKQMMSRSQSSYGEKGKHTPGLARLTKNNDTEVPQDSRSKSIAVQENEDHDTEREDGKRGGNTKPVEKAGATTVKSTRGKGRPRIKYSGWYDAAGKPIPVPTAKEKPKSSILEAVDEIVSKANGKRTTVPSKRGPIKGSKAVKKGKDKEDDRLKFGMIPTGAGPGSMFPIVKGLEKQRQLPVKGFIVPSPISSSSTEEKLPGLDIDALVGGVADTARKEMLQQQEQKKTTQIARPVLKSSSDKGTREFDKREVVFNKISESLTKVRKMQRSQDQVYSVDDPDRSLEELSAIEDVTNQTVLKRLKQQCSRDSSSYPYSATRSTWKGTYHDVPLPSLEPSGPTAQTEHIETPSNDHSCSTITHVSLPDNRSKPFHGAPSSSSQLPYSSPLARQCEPPSRLPYVGLTTPLPRHYTGHGMHQVNQLEDSVNMYCGQGLEAEECGQDVVDPIDQRPVNEANSIGHEARYLPQRRSCVSPSTEESTTYGQHVEERVSFSHLGMTGGVDDFMSRGQTEYSPYHPHQPTDCREYPFNTSRRRKWDDLSDMATKINSNSPEWATLAKRRRSDPHAEPYAKTASKFRLPSKIFDVKTKQDIQITTPSSAQSARASWFRPSARVNENSKALEYTLKTNKGTQPYAPSGDRKQPNQNKTPHFAKSKYWGSSDDREEDPDNFHEQIINSLGQDGHARASMRQNNAIAASFNNDSTNSEEIQDWRTTWKRQSHRQADPTVSKYIFARSDTPTKTIPSTQGAGRAFDW